MNLLSIQAILIKNDFRRSDSNHRVASVQYVTGVEEEHLPNYGSLAAETSFGLHTAVHDRG
jgi:hypothetical protein